MFRRIAINIFYLCSGGSGFHALGALAALGRGFTDDDILDESLPPEVFLLYNSDMSNFRQLADFRLFCLVLGHAFL